MQRNTVTGNYSAPTKQFKDLTIVILHYSRPKDLRMTLQILQAINKSSLDYEIIVVDNASTDGPPATPQNVHLIESKSNIGTSAWNLGFQKSKGKYILVLDDDCHIALRDIMALLEAANTEGADLITCDIFDKEPSSGGRSYHDVFPTGLLSFWGCCALIRRSAIEEIGGFDPNIFLWAHELEFTFRLLNSGKKHVFVPNVHAIHRKPVPTPGESSSHKRRLNLKNHCYIAAKFLRTPHVIKSVLALWVAVLYLSLRHLNLAFLHDFLSGLRTGFINRAPVVDYSLSRKYAAEWPYFGLMQQKKISKPRSQKHLMIG